jgi:hypothetical protein
MGVPLVGRSVRAPAAEQGGISLGLPHGKPLHHSPMMIIGKAIFVPQEEHIIIESIQMVS